ncbi:hypothetical protein Pmani_024384 [Petrolisthes manimaculis]|uniref:RNA polymerase II-associated factor 1 homolog n=1 Tax=Petrolisthes manimaculis TaxID=1843537 RepID=A0AAE1PA96_9EUCA|nr:hypothetical protein Pmani_024384 [Petrolisthes manimaculis]
MPPTVNQAHAVEREKRPRTGERRSDLVCRVKYCNTLPDIPFDPKFINYPFDSNRYVRYKQTSLEKNYKYEVLTEHDLGVTIDLINPEAYIPLPNTQLHPTDEKLLEDDILTPQDAKRSRHHHVNVPWLRRTEYISTEPTRFQPQTNEKIEATVGFATRRKNDENVYTDRESQLEAIEKTFEDIKKPLINHYSKPGVTAVEEQPVYPDFALWKYPCAQVIFDSDPAPVGRPMPAQLEEMSQAMIRGVMDESGEQFVAYFLPTTDTLTKRKRDKDEGMDYQDEEEYDYIMAREYNWNVKNKASKGYEENYFMVLRNDGVYYNELETRVRLSKRRLKQGQQPNNSRLVVRHRPLIAMEHKTQRFRERMLEPPGDEEEEEEEEMEEEDEEEEMEVEQNEKEGSAKGSDDEGSERSRSRSRSKARSRSGSRSGASRSRSRSKSKSRSRSRSASGSRGGTRTPSPAGSRSRSRSKSRSKSKSPSRSRSRSRSKSRSKSKSASRSRSRSASRSRSGSPASSKSRSRSRSRSRSKSGSRSPAGSERSARSGASSRSGRWSRKSGSPAPAQSKASRSGSDSGSDSESSASGSASDSE